MSDVTWREDGWGSLIENGIVTRSVVNFKMGITYTIDQYLAYICATPQFIHALCNNYDYDGPSMANSRGVAFNLAFIYPKITGT